MNAIKSKFFLNVIFNVTFIASPNAFLVCRAYSKSINKFFNFFLTPALGFYFSVFYSNVTSAASSSTCLKILIHPSRRSIKNFVNSLARRDIFFLKILCALTCKGSLAFLIHEISSNK